MDFLITPLDINHFRPLLRMDAADLAQHHARWQAVDAHPGCPCVVSLQDALTGERVLVAHHTHHDVEGPFRAAGPVYIREHADTVHLDTNAVPPLLQQRELALRGYTGSGDLQVADIGAGSQLESSVERLFTDPAVQVLHAHDAATGTYLCRIQRAGPGS